MHVKHARAEIQSYGADVVVPRHITLEALHVSDRLTNIQRLRATEITATLVASSRRRLLLAGSLPLPFHSLVHIAVAGEFSDPCFQHCCSQRA